MGQSVCGGYEKYYDNSVHFMTVCEGCCLHKGLHRLTRGVANSV